MRCHQRNIVISSSAEALFDAAIREHGVFGCRLELDEIEDEGTRSLLAELRTGFHQRYRTQFQKFRTLD